MTLPCHSPAPNWTCLRRGSCSPHPGFPQSPPRCCKPAPAVGAAQEESHDSRVRATVPCVATSPAVSVSSNWVCSLTRPRALPRELERYRPHPYKSCRVLVSWHSVDAALESGQAGFAEFRSIGDADSEAMSLWGPASPCPLGPTCVCPFPKPAPDPSCSGSPPLVHRFMQTPPDLWGSCCFLQRGTSLAAFLTPFSLPHPLTHLPASLCQVKEDNPFLCRVD